MDKRIIDPKLPDMPSELVDAINDNKLVIFVGAGLSALFGFKLWGELANDMVDYCFNKGVIGNSFKATLKSYDYEPLQKISISNNYLSSINPNEGIEFIAKSLSSENAKKKVNIEKVGSLLSHYNCGIVTTNADLSLDGAKDLLKYKTYNNLDDLPGLNDAIIPPKAIIHLHGSINRKGKMIFTINQYAKNYKPDSTFGKKLNKLLKNGDYTFLFIGYGLNEFDLIRYFFKDKKPGSPYKLYKIDGYLDKDYEKKELDIKYYETLGVNLIPYSIEDNGYESLISLLEKWDVKVQTETIADINDYITINSLINKKPNAGSIKYVSDALDEDSTPKIIRMICSSPYSTKWAVPVCLNNKNLLLDVDKYFKPAVASKDGKTYKSYYWPGLVLVEDYCRKTPLSKDKKMLKLIINLFSNCLEKLEIDLNKKDKYKKRSSSYAIMEMLCIIAFSTEEIINNKNLIIPFIKHYMDSSFFDSYHLPYLIKEAVVILTKSDQDNVFELLTTIVGKDKTKNDYAYEELSDPFIKDIISNNAIKYYDFSLNEIKKKKNQFYSMGSFGLYATASLADARDKMMITWFVEASRFVPETFLIEQANELLKDKNRVLRKAGTYLIAVNYKKCRDVFCQNIDLLFSEKDYYPDLLQLLTNNLDLVFNDKEVYSLVKTTLEKASFGEDSDIYISVLKQKITNVLSTIDSEFKYNELSKVNNEFVDNYTKLAYVSNYDGKEAVNTLYEKYKGVEINDLPAIYNEMLSNPSAYFESSVTKAIIRILLEKQFDEYAPILPRFGKTFIDSFTNDLYNTLKNNDAFIEKLSVIISYSYEIMDEHSVHSLLFELSRIAPSENNISYFEQIIVKIDFSLIKIGDIQYEDKNIINHIINDTIYMVLSLFIKVSSISVEVREKLKTLLSEYETKYYGNWLFDAIIANLYPSFMLLDEQFYSYLFDKYFVQIDDDRQYTALAYSNDFFRYGGEKLMNILCSTEQFRKYLSKENDNSGGYYSPLNIMKSRVVMFYVFEGKYLELCESVLLTSNHDTIQIVISNLAQYFDEYKKDVNINERVDKLLDSIIVKYNNIQIKEDEKNDMDQLIRTISRLLCKDPTDYKLWQIQLITFAFFDSFLSDETKEVFARFKGDHKEEITKMMNIYIDSYQEYKTYEKTLIEVLDLFKTDMNYSTDYNRWKKKLLKKNINLKKIL